MLRKIINRESLENSQENVSDKVYLLLSCKPTRTTATLDRLHPRIFPEYVPKTRCLKK